MAELKLADVLGWSGGHIMQPPDFECLHLLFNDIVTDSRRITPGCLFIALRGARYDGHEFAGEALRQGASAVMVELRSFPELHFQGSDCVIAVDDTLQALQDLAAGYRRQLPAHVIVISGSVGKTSTREMAAACLRPFWHLHQTAANLNNEIGLPQTLLQASPEHEAILLEMGMRGRGEISLLSRIAAPDTAILTGIGWSHVERLGSQAAILEAKAEVLDGMSADGLLILNADDSWLNQLAARIDDQVRLAGFTLQDAAPWPQAKIWLRAVNIKMRAGELRFTLVIDRPLQLTGEYDVSLPLTGLHHIRNFLPALAVALDHDLDINRAIAAASAFRNIGSRQRILRANQLTIMDDAYNASPESMQAALESLALMAGGRHRMIAVLGDMLELGDFAADAHRQVGEAVVRYGADSLFCLGPLGRLIGEAARESQPSLPTRCFDHRDDLIRELMAYVQDGDHILVKGSRALNMELVAEALAAEPSDAKENNG
ncbi:MAG: UDP-N-acetylmuramoyl-tripeptide--D-alanyl-D-alanine ligase [Eubacteriales bacterium]|nr:UDP-N-acetylmuramoyl-tripeptide--D-alanyl-D-alanine ligase [Eubacteriales bacterium]